MKKLILWISSVVMVAGLVGFTQFAGRAQSDSKDVSSIEGVWRTVVTPRICATGNPLPITFPGILMFEKGGTATGTSTAVTSAYGLWNRDPGEHKYSFALLSFRYDPTGTLLGTRRIDQAVVLGEDGDSFVSSGTFEDRDLAGNVAASGCSTSTGSRFQK